MARLAGVALAVIGAALAAWHGSANLGWTPAGCLVFGAGVLAVRWWKGFRADAEERAEWP